jgi:hypothetical protein
MDWSAVAALSAVFTGLIILGSVIVLLRQTRELKRATHAQAYFTALEYLQNDKVRFARKKLMEFGGKPLHSWLEPEKWTAEKVCQSFDSVAIMVRHGMLPKELIIENWMDSLIRCWAAAEQLVNDYRKIRGPEYWDDFEWLANEARKRRKKKAQK